MDGNDTAYPIAFDTQNGLQVFSGLTKRELFAMAAMQGFLSVMASPEVLGSIAMGAKEAGIGPDQYIAEHAVAQADALLAALNAEKSK